MGIPNHIINSRESFDLVTKFSEYEVSRHVAGLYFYYTF